MMSIDQMTEQEWGPWIEHDGKHQPPLGTYVMVQVDKEALFEWRGPPRCVFEHVMRENHMNTACWLWAVMRPKRDEALVTRYRIRNPRSVEMLKRIAQDVETETLKARLEMT